MNDTTTTNTTTTPASSQTPAPDSTDETGNARPKRVKLQGAVVFDRVHREVLKLRRLIEDYRERREPDSEDAVTKDVFDALDDLSKVTAELQGVVEVLEHTVYEQRPDVVAKYREQKRERAARRRGEKNADLHRYRVSSSVLRQAEES